MSRGSNGCGSIMFEPKMQVILNFVTRNSLTNEISIFSENENRILDFD